MNQSDGRFSAVFLGFESPTEKAGWYLFFAGILVELVLFLSMLTSINSLPSYIAIATAFFTLTAHQVLVLRNFRVGTISTRSKATGILTLIGIFFGLLNGEVPYLLVVTELAGFLKEFLGLSDYKALYKSLFFFGIALISFTTAIWDIRSIPQTKANDFQDESEGRALSVLGFSTFWKFFISDVLSLCMASLLIWLVFILDSLNEKAPLDEVHRVEIFICLIVGGYAILIASRWWSSFRVSPERIRNLAF